MTAIWESKPLGELVDFQRGLNYSKSDEVASSATVVLRATNIDLKTSTLDLTELRHISDKVTVPISKIVQRGSLLICTASGSKTHLGKVALIDKDYGYAFGGFMGMLTPRPSVLPRYLFYVMTSPEYKRFIGELSDGANINNLRFNDLARFTMSVPPLSEQKRIVATLDQAFAAIGTATTNARKNALNAKALFDSYMNSILRRRDELWRDEALVSLCEYFVDSAHRTPKYQDIGIPALRPRDVANGILNLESAALVSEAEYTIQSKRHKPRPGDIVYSRELTFGWAAMLPEQPRVCLSQGMCLFRPKADISTEYLLFVLNGAIGRSQAIARAVGAAHPHINLSAIKAYRIPVPKLALQRKLAHKLGAVQERCATLGRVFMEKAEGGDALRHSILSYAASGRL